METGDARLLRGKRDERAGTRRPRSAPMWARGTPSQPLEPPGKLVKIFTTTTEHAAQHATHIDVTFPAGRPGGSAQPNASEDAASPARSETNVSGAAARGLAYIRFRNFYSHSVTVRQLMTPLDGPPEAARWSTLLADYRLMESAHHEDDAQAWHVLCAETDFRRGRFFPDKLTRLRFVVSQPSSMWSTSSLRPLQILQCHRPRRGRVRARSLRNRSIRLRTIKRARACSTTLARHFRRCSGVQTSSPIHCKSCALASAP